MECEHDCQTRQRYLEKVKQYINYLLGGKSSFGEPDAKRAKYMDTGRPLFICLTPNQIQMVERYILNKFGVDDILISINPLCLNASMRFDEDHICDMLFYQDCLEKLSHCVDVAPEQYIIEHRNKDIPLYFDIQRMIEEHGGRNMKDPLNTTSYLIHEWSLSQPFLYKRLATMVKKEIMDSYEETIDVPEPPMRNVDVSTVEEYILPKCMNMFLDKLEESYWTETKAKVIMIRVDDTIGVLEAIKKWIPMKFNRIPEIIDASSLQGFEKSLYSACRIRDPTNKRRHVPVLVSLTEYSSPEVLKCLRFIDKVFIVCEDIYEPYLRSLRTHEDTTIIRLNSLSQTQCRKLLNGMICYYESHGYEKKIDENLKNVIVRMSNSKPCAILHSLNMFYINDGDQVFGSDCKYRDTLKMCFELIKVNRKPSETLAHIPLSVLNEYIYSCYPELVNHKSKSGKNICGLDSIAISENIIDDLSICDTFFSDFERSKPMCPIVEEIHAMTIRANYQKQVVKECKQWEKCQTVFKDVVRWNEEPTRPKLRKETSPFEKNREWNQWKIKNQRWKRHQSMNVIPFYDDMKQKSKMIHGQRIVKDSLADRNPEDKYFIEKCNLAWHFVDGQDLKRWLLLAIAMFPPKDISMFESLVHVPVDNKATPQEFAKLARATLPDYEYFECTVWAIVWSHTVEDIKARKERPLVLLENKLFKTLQNYRKYETILSLVEHYQKELIEDVTMWKIYCLLKHTRDIKEYKKIEILCRTAGDIVLE